MAPAAAASNWLSFSLSPMEMLASSHHQNPQIIPSPVPSSHHYFLDSFYSHDWSNPKGYTDYVVEQHLENPTTVPKLEDFFGGGPTNNNNTTSFNESPAQDTSSQLTHLYDPHANFYPHGQGFQTASFSNNSGGSEVDDSTAHLGPACDLVAQSTDSPAQPDPTAYAGNNGGGSLSLSVSVASHHHTSSDKSALVPVAVAVAESDTSKKPVADTFGQRTSIYRGVTRHRWTGRYEAHLWDNSCRREGQARKGRQVFLGGYDKEDKAARAYDLAALKYWGPTATTNFPISNYSKELEEMKHVTKQEFIASLRRKSSGFSRGASIYRGVTRHHQQGRWQARIGRVAGNKDLYLGTFATEEEAAEAYDIAAIKFRGVNAVTNFEMNRYDVEAILKSNLPIGGAAKRLKLATESSEQKQALSLDQHSQSSNGSSGTTGSTINFSGIQSVAPISCNVPFDAATTLFHQNLLHHLASGGGAQGVVGSDAYASVVGPMALMPQTPGEFYIWPHQSY